MLNFIRFDLRKLFSMKSFWFTLFIVFAVTIAFSTLEARETKMTYDEYVDSQSKNNEENKKAGMPILELLSKEEFDLKHEGILFGLRLDQSIPKNVELVAIAAYIFFAVFVGNDFSSGYLKNILAIKGAKWKWVTSKIFLAIVYSIIMFIVIGAVGIYGEIMTNQFPTNFDIGKILAMVGLQTLRLIISMLLVVAIMLLVQKKVTLTTISALLAMGLFHQILTKIGEVINFNIVEKLYSTKLAMMGYEFDGQINTVLIIGLITALILYLFNRYYIYQIDFKFEN